MTKKLCICGCAGVYWRPHKHGGRPIWRCEQHRDRWPDYVAASDAPKRICPPNPELREVNQMTDTKVFNDYFGGCPECGGNHGCVSIGRDHWIVCHDHKTKWWIGSNLFSTWRDLSPAEHRWHERVLASYTKVQPLNTCPPDPPGGARITSR
jgi:hypothetical protein